MDMSHIYVQAVSSVNSDFSSNGNKFSFDLIYSNTLLKKGEKERQSCSKVGSTFLQGHGGLMSGLLARFLSGFGTCEVHASQELFVLLVLIVDPL